MFVLFVLQEASWRLIISVFSKKGFSSFMKIDTPEFRALFSPELTTLASLFRDYGYELRIAGGAVR
jgi:hypothetical protein